MKRVGLIFLGIGFGILCYIIFTLFFKSNGVVSPVEESPINKVIQQNNK
jgi:hypothetical protein